MRIASDDPVLFHHGELSEVLRVALEKVKQEAEKVNQPQLMGTAIDELVDRIVDTHTVSALELHDEQIYATMDESRIPIERLGDALFPFGNGAIDGTMVQYHVPFSGDPGLFKLRPNKWTSNPPRGVVQGNELVLTFLSRNVGDHVKREFEQILSAVRTYVGNQRPLLDHHNKSVVDLARRTLTERINRIRQAEQGAAALGVPLRRRGDAPTTYTAPEVRRRLPSTGPSQSKPAVSTPPEPTLPDAEYAHILKVMRNMALVLERSPSAFEAIGEEGIRWHFIVQLNGQYEGQATGETFNFSGKTDILVRSGARNIFIAECKFWKGPKAFGDTVDQLLGYLTWRDSKAAIVVFNREVQFSTVLATLPDALAGHRSCAAPVRREDETTFSTILARPDDPVRKIALTVMVFDVPKRTVAR